jgi:hypothetical protein
MKKVLILAIGMAVAAPSFAVFFESESNNSAATANTISRITGPWADIGIAALNNGTDRDWFRVRLFAGEDFTAITTPRGNNDLSSPDTIMALIGPNGTTILTSNDDAGGLGSAVRFRITQTGDYFIAVTGFGAGDPSNINTYTGNTDHGKTGDYALTVSAVPEPATMAALGLGLAAFAARRRRK